ncbi:TA system VapC family ribonuclease toxin [Pararhizobium sp. O133]|uniref:TA system VapC family ribonuclease toxin n=1 Tax=Pararhizobium sp. O133 TaxID=3449278 RepID=UPI003F688BF4
MTLLLDVNVLIALADSGHSHHLVASNWFEKFGQTDWATCPLTENGMIRILSNPRYGNPTPNAAMATELLHLLRLSGKHSFWHDDISLANSKIFVRDKLTSKHTTDTYLLGLAKAHGGQLATFDRRLSARAVIGGTDALHLIE